MVALPWLRDVDGAWLAEVAGGAPIVTLDNHYVTGGQGDAVLAALAAEAPEAAARVHKIGVTEHPEERRATTRCCAHTASTPRGSPRRWPRGSAPASWADRLGGAARRRLPGERLQLSDPPFGELGQVPQSGSCGSTGSRRKRA